MRCGARLACMAVAALVYIVASTTPAAAHDWRYSFWRYANPPSSQRTVTVKEGKFLPLASLIPDKPFELSAIAYDEERKELLPQGLQLTGLTGKPTVACTIYSPPKGARHVCLVDSDEDGKFDRYFRFWSASRAMITPVRMKKPRPIEPVAYREIGPEEVKHPPLFGVEFQHWALSNRGSFRVAVSYDDGFGITYMTSVTEVADRNIPATIAVPLNGGKIKVLSWIDGMLTVEFAPPVLGEPATFYGRSQQGILGGLVPARSIQAAANLTGAAS